MYDILKETYNVEKNSFVIPHIIDIDFLNKINPKAHLFKSSDEFKIFIPSAGSVIKGERYVFSIMHRLSNQVKNKKLVTNEY